MEHIIDTMIQLIRSEICEEKVSLKQEVTFNAEFLIELLVLSRKHNIAHIVTTALLKNGYLENCPQKGQFVNEIYTAVYAYEKMSETVKEIYSLFERNKICYIPLKGAVIRELYPEPWLRTSCDIDILVKKEYLEEAVKLLEEKCGCTEKVRGNHDVALVTPDGIVIELHYRLLGKKSSPLYSRVMSQVWRTAEKEENSEHCYKLSKNIFCYYLEFIFLCLLVYFY